MAGGLADEDGLTVAIIGTGLIGASISKGLLASGFATETLGDDINPDALKKSKVTRQLDLLQDAEKVQIWVLATPPDAILPWLRRLAEIAGADSVITDTNSVKESIVNCVPEQLSARFVGGHPLCGTNAVGTENSNGDLFADQHWVLTPVNASETAVKRIEQMIFALDAIPVHMSPSEHDIHLAALCHVPSTLASLLDGLSRDMTFAHVCDALRSMQTGVNPELWAQILVHNRTPVIETLDAFEERLQALRAALAEEDHEAVRRILAE